MGFEGLGLKAYDVGLIIFWGLQVYLNPKTVLGVQSGRNPQGTNTCVHVLGFLGLEQCSSANAGETAISKPHAQAALYSGLTSADMQTSSDKSEALNEYLKTTQTPKQIHFSVVVRTRRFLTLSFRLGMPLSTYVTMRIRTETERERDTYIYISIRN